MISEVDLRDWDPVEMKNILTGIEFNYVYNGKESPFGRRDMDVLMKFLSKAEEVRKSLVPQVPVLLKRNPDGFTPREGDGRSTPMYIMHEWSL